MAPEPEPEPDWPEDPPPPPPLDDWPPDPVVPAFDEFPVFELLAVGAILVSVDPVVVVAVEFDMFFDQTFRN